MKTDPDRLQPERYPWRLELHSRFSDTDAAGHLNNVAIARCYDDARAMLELDLFDGLSGSRLLLVRADVSYLREAHFPHPVVIGCSVGDIGETYFHLAQALFQKASCTGTCDAVLVTLGASGQPAAINEKQRVRLEALRIRT